MSFLDTIARRRGPRRRRLAKTFVAKTVFFGGFTAFFIYVVVAFGLFGPDLELKTIPATRDSSEVIDVVQQYLRTATHRGFSNRGEPSSCWDIFENEEFKANYLLLGSWQVHAWYRPVRYFWRVDDKSMEVTQDKWLETYLPTIDC